LGKGLPLRIGCLPEKAEKIAVYDGGICYFCAGAGLKLRPFSCGAEMSGTSGMSESISPRKLSELIGSIYDCALDPDLWVRTLKEIMKVMDCYVAMLTLVHVPHSRFLITKVVGELYEGVEEGGGPLIEKEEGHISEIAGWTQTYCASLGPDEPAILSRHIPAEVRAQSPYLRECVTPFGVVDTFQYTLMQTQGRLALFAFARHESQGPVTDRVLELGRLLLPHVRRAVTISNVLDARTIERARMAEALDALRCGVALVNADGEVLHVNEAAEHMLRNGGALRGVRGMVAAKSAEATQELRDAIRLAASDETALGKTGLAVKLTDGETPIFAHVLPMNGSEIRTRLQPAAVAAIFIGAPEVEDGAALVAEAFGLTKAESRVLSRLLAGSTLAETAEDLGVSFATARTHLEAIFLKTGVKRQAELVRLAARFVPAAG
jgi:DNA-binding CsgD family transcriptional regulator/PAS domain-containing protein